MAATLLTEDEITARLAAVPEWARNGAQIERTVKRADFVGAMKFVNAVAEIAERHSHHPDIDIRWNKVTLVLSTHSAGGLTEKDFAAAEEMDRAAG
jgi:4a-hydroxytetrahydrobiopterin dehydratase